MFSPPAYSPATVISMKVSIIGYGNIGSTMAEALLEKKALRPEHLVVANRTREKTAPLLAKYPGVSCADNAQAAAWGDIVFLCVRTPQVLPVLREITPCMSEEQHLVITNGGVRLENVASVFSGAVSKLVPSIAMRSGRGVSLLCHEQKVGSDARSRLEGLLAHLGMVCPVQQDQFEVAADLTSCAPALWAALAQHFADAGCRHSDLSPADAYLMVTETLLASASLLRDGGVLPDQMRELVATPGGITEQGLMVLDRKMPDVFDELLVATTAKHEETKSKVRQQFESP
ncbi:MAG: pyrroline-5-carboxylate reductase dimerization domain-containing protein [Methanomassiliicoccales archaeon]